MQVEKIGNRYVALCSYAERVIPKAAGFRWDPAEKVWYTNDRKRAEALADDDGQMQASLDAAQARAAAAIADSRATDAAIEIPCPEGRAYLPYQRAGVAYAASHPATLLGDEMGLGKTIEAIGTISADPSVRRVLVVCPASLRINWQREMEAWLTPPRPTIIVTAGMRWPDDRWDVVIVNYDIAYRYADEMRRTRWDAIILDEAHMLKSPGSRRTKAILGSTKRGQTIAPVVARRKLALTGTPLPSRPIEAQPILGWLCPAEFGNYWRFASRYADAHQGRFGWDVSGASHLDELQAAMRASCMIRRLKADVLTELPPKRRSIVVIPADGATSVVSAEVAAWSRHQDMIAQLRADAELAKASGADAYAAAVGRLRAATMGAFTELARLRHDTAVQKIPRVVEHALNALESEAKISIFAHHRDVVAGIVAGLEAGGIRCVSITGDTPMGARQEAVDLFQTDPSVRGFVGNIQAAGVGLTLTAASHVIFAELDFVPGNVSQAEDRHHRIGQRDMVLVEHIVIDGSLDARMAKTLIAKQAVIDAALDAQHHADDDMAEPDADSAATHATSRRQVEAEAESIAPEQIDAIHSGLKALAGMDGDFAQATNGIGFSKIDSRIGHSLAEAPCLTPRQAAIGLRLIHKYRRQLPEGLAASAGAT